MTTPSVQRTMTDWHEHFRLHREMKAADLGLRDSRSSGCDVWDRLYGCLSHRQPSDAPYSFWLGADHA